MKFVCILLLLLISYFDALSQTTNSRKEYDLSGNNRYPKIAEFKNGNILVAFTGAVWDRIPGSSETEENVIACINKAGEVIWRKSKITEKGSSQVYRSSIVDVISDVNDGIFIISNVQNQINNDLVIGNGILTKVNDTGDTLLTSIFLTDSANISLSKIVPLENGEFFLLGNLFNREDSVNHCIIYKCNKYGKELWHKLYSSEYGLICYNAAKNFDNNLIITGLKGSWLDREYYSSVFMCIDSSGTIIWEKDYPEFKYESYRYIYPANDGRFVAGSYNDINKRINLNVFSKTGELDLQMLLYTNSNISFGGLASQDGVNFTYWASSSLHNTEYLVGQMDTAGYCRWKYIFSEPTSGDFNGNSTDIIPLKTGEYLLAGFISQIRINDSKDKLRSAITLQKIDNNGNVLHFYTDKCINAYPNPTRDKVVIDLPLNKNEQPYLILISDLQGRVLIDYKVKTVPATIDLSAFRCSLYFYTVYSNNKVVCSGKILKE